MTDRRCCRDSLVFAAPNTFELVEDTVVLVQIAELAPQVVVNWDGLHRLALHVDIPDLEVQVVARQDVPSIVAELHVRD